MNHREMHFFFQYKALGWALCPCSATNKAPILPKTETSKGGWYRACTDTGDWLKWASEFPGCLWGVRPADFVVLDADLKHGGMDRLAELVAVHGPLPETPTVRTGGGGRHYYFVNEWAGNKKLGCEGLELIGAAKGVVLPPSVHPDTKKAYEWETAPWDRPMAELPAWLLALAQGGLVVVRDDAANSDNALVTEADPFELVCGGGGFVNLKCLSPGERNRPVADAIVAERLAGVSEDDCREQGRVWAEANGYDIDELNRKITSIYANASFVPKIAIPSFPVVASGGEEERKGCPSTPLGHDGDFSLSRDAYHGLFGEMLTAIAPHTEADSAGILLGWLTCFGSIVGRKAYFTVGAEQHFPSLYVGQVGLSSAGKNVAWGVARWPFERVAPEWAKDCIEPGVGSGEGLLERVADPERIITADGEVTTTAGAADKRCLVRLGELSRCFKAQRNEKSSLSEFLRQMWDGGPVSIPNRAGNRLRASDYAMSVFGDITPTALKKALAGGGTEGEDGWMNRFLWVEVRCGNDVPTGGTMSLLEPFLDRLESLVRGFAAGDDNGIQMTRDSDAERLWASVYSDLKRSGDDVPHTERARPYVVRLSMIYALADGTKTVGVVHLKAALAVWDYCRESARRLFSGTEPGKSNDSQPLDLRLLNLIQENPGVRRTDIRRVATSRVKAATIESALSSLEVRGFAHKKHEFTGGKRAECWYPGKEGTTPLLSEYSSSCPSENQEGIKGAMPIYSGLPFVPSTSSDDLVLVCGDDQPVIPFRSHVVISDHPGEMNEGVVTKPLARLDTDKSAAEDIFMAEWKCQVAALGESPPASTFEDLLREYGYDPEGFSKEERKEKGTDKGTE